MAIYSHTGIAIARVGSFTRAEAVSSCLPAGS